MRRRLRLLIPFAVLLPVLLCAAPLTGTRSVGPTGDYASLTAAIADIQVQTVGGPLVLELQAAYVGSIETFPLTVPALNGANADNTVTIRPATGATGLSISSGNTTAATVDLNGARFVTIDGRPGGVGSNAGSGGGAASQLTIANTSAAGLALRFINEASSNTVRYAKIQGVNTINARGVVYFGGTTGANGNDDNTIDHCDIGDGASTPKHCIYSAGGSATPDQKNSGDTISNCNIFNFYTSTVNDSTGMRIEEGNTGWNITGNSFYQTTSRAALAGDRPVRAIHITTPSGDGFTVTGNFIGGRAANAGGAAWTTTGTSAAYQFVGIHLNVGTTTPSSVQGNTISNIVWTSTSNASALPGVWSGIYLEAGSADIGTVTGNTIGSGTGTDSISVFTTGNGGTSFGIGSKGSGTVAIANNTIGSITMVNGTGVSGQLTGISVTAGTNIISGNLVGSTNTANSLNAGSSTSANASQLAAGIVSSSSGRTTITGNTVANINNSYTGISNAGQVRGIVTSAGVNTITGNTVRNLTTTSQNASTIVVLPSVLGIIQTSAASGQTIARNVVHSLANTTVFFANTTVMGIYYEGSATGTDVIEGNFVHSLSLSTPSTSSRMFGIIFGPGAFTARNNMVDIGANPGGTTPAFILNAILDNAGTAGRKYHHNSVYVGGTQSSSANTSFAFTSAGSGNARDIRDNIFVNARRNSGGTGKHYAVQYGGTGANPVGLTSDNNLFFVSGTGGVLGRYGGVDRASLAAWQAVTGVDAASLAVDPLFADPAGDAAHLDLHLLAESPAAGAGTPIAAVTDDFDGSARDAAAPDIGADEIVLTTPDIAVAQAGALADDVGSVDFGAVSTPRRSAQLGFTITNPGTAELTSLAIGKDGADAGDFTVSALSATGLAAGTGTVTFTVTFAPSAVGVRTAAIHITNNVAGLKNPFDIVLTGTGFNVAPVIGADSIVRMNTSRIAKIAKSVLLGNDTDADGDTLALTGSFSNVLPAGSLISDAGGFVTFIAPSINAGNGSFDYTLSDGQGHIVAGTVTVTEGSPPPSSEPPNASGIVLVGNDVVLSYLGVAGNRYRIQYTTNVAAPYTWSEFNPIAVHTAPANGVFTHTDVNPPGPVRLYRAIPHP